MTDIRIHALHSANVAVSVRLLRAVTSPRLLVRISRHQRSTVVPRHQEVVGLDNNSAEMDATVTEAVEAPDSESLDMPRTAAVDKANAETNPASARRKKIYIVGVAFALLGATIAACVVGFLRILPRATILTDNGIPWVYSKGDPGELTYAVLFSLLLCLRSTLI